MEAVILAGGLGTRLRPYTTDVPKPLVPVGDRPIIEILVSLLKKGGVTRVHLAVNHLAHLIMAVLGDGERFGLEIIYSREDKPLSTVGPVKLIRNLPENFIVVNGDVISDLDIRKLYDYHLEQKALLTVATCRRTERIDYGVIESDGSGIVKTFSEKPSYSFRVSMGFYVFSKTVLSLVPDKQAFGFDDLMNKLLQANERIAAFDYGGYWLDVGRPDDYERARQDVALIESWLK